MIETQKWNVVRASVRVLDFDRIRKQPPSLAGTEELPLGSVVVDPADRNRILLAYLPAPLAHERDLRQHLLKVKIAAGTRTLGLTARSVTFGNVPRLEVRGRDWCRTAQFNEEHPDLYRLLAAQCGVLEGLYEQIAPDAFSDHAMRADEIRGEWRLPGSRAFTGGVVNRDSNIGYHHDSGNITDVWSAMIAVRRGTTGGELVLPELGLHLPIADKSVTYFDGQGLLHGVTPIGKTSRDGYRFTVVYYSTRRLWQCLAPTDELERAKDKRTERAQRRAGLIR